MPKGGLINAEDIGGFLKGLGGGDNSAYVVFLDQLQRNMVTQLERRCFRSNGRGEVFNLNGIAGAKNRSPFDRIAQFPDITRP
jgi:hypothetical protein